MNRSLLQRRRLLGYLGLGALGVGGAVLQLGQRRTDSPTSVLQELAASAGSATLASLPVGRSLPEFQGISQWLNSEPLRIADLKGKVVLVQFWTFACINCQRTLPSITRWHQQYAAQGLSVIGIHTPELAFERDLNNVRRALAQNRITYPVPIDAQFKTWSAYNNRYWPHLFLADRDGFLRYDHIGEGAYDQTEQAIRRLLA